MQVIAAHADVDKYLSGLFAPHDAALQNALAASTAAGLPEIQVSATQGKFLFMMARLMNARTILEVGTLGGYSAIWMARALPKDGLLVTLEFDPKHAEVARKNVAAAGLSERVDIRIGRALDTLPQIAGEGLGPFDIVFIDADKESNPDYFTWALKLTRPGSFILVDNVVREGAVLDADSSDASVKGTRRVLEMMASEPRVSATALQGVGQKGWDGLAMAVVIS